VVGHHHSVARLLSSWFPLLLCKNVVVSIIWVLLFAKYYSFLPVLRIRDVYPESRFRLFSIPDPNCLRPGSRIRIKEFKYFNLKKWFLSSRKYDPGCSSRIPVPDADLLPIPDHGSRGQKGTGSWIPDPVCNTGFSLSFHLFSRLYSTGVTICIIYNLLSL
jgi:hypothetical protein